MTTPEQAARNLESARKSQRRSRARGLPEGDRRHGTNTGYTNHGCRCKPCTYAASAHRAVLFARRVAKGLPPGDDRHGTTNGYSNWGCRCDLCTAAWAEKNRKRRRGKVKAMPIDPGQVPPAFPYLSLSCALNICRACNNLGCTCPCHSITDH